MHSFLEHITINVSNPSKSLPFYKEFFRYFEYDVFKEDEEKCRAAGMDDFLTKPVEIKALREKILKWGRGGT